MSQLPNDGKVITKNKASRKQDFKDIIGQISTLESKVELMLQSFEKIQKIQSISQHQNESGDGNLEVLEKMIPTDNNTNTGFTFTHSAFNTMNLETPISSVNPITPYNVDKDLLRFAPTPKPHEKRPLSPNYGPSSKSASPSNIKKDTPLNLLADVITNQYEQRLISERIQEDNFKASSSLNNWNSSPSNGTSNFNGESVLSLNSSHTVLRTIAEIDIGIKNNWNSLRNNIPNPAHQLFDSIDVDDMYIDFEREKKIYGLIEIMQIPKIPT